MLRERIGQDQRRTAARDLRVHGDCNDAAEREPADVRAIDFELAHREQDGRRIILATRALRRRVALAIARIIECDRAPLAGKRLELQPPNRFVRTDAVEEDNRQMLAVAGLLIADLNSETRLDAPHQPYLGTMAPPALASPNDADDGQRRGGPLQDRPRY